MAKKRLRSPTIADTPADEFQLAQWWVSLHPAIAWRVLHALNSLDASHESADAWIRLESGLLRIVATDGLAGVHVTVNAEHGWLADDSPRAMDQRGKSDDWVRMHLAEMRGCFGDECASYDELPDWCAFGFYAAGVRPEAPDAHIELCILKSRSAKIIDETRPPSKGVLAPPEEDRLSAWTRLLSEMRDVAPRGDAGFFLTEVDAITLAAWSAAVEPTDCDPPLPAIWVRPVDYGGNTLGFHASGTFLGIVSLDGMMLSSGLTRMVEGTLWRLFPHPEPTPRDEVLEEPPPAETKDADGWTKLLRRLDADDRSVIETGIAALSERERLVLRLRFGLSKGSSPMSLRQIGDVLDVTNERVRQIERKALEGLKTK